MFDTQNVPMYLDGISHRVIKDKQNEELKAVDLLFRMEPISPVLAAELSDAIKGTLFRRNDGEINPHIKAVQFAFKPKPQSIVFRSEPTIKPSLEIDEAKLTKFRARIPKDSKGWVFFFTATVANLSGQQLLVLQDSLYKMHYVSMANSVAGLFDEDEKQERKARGRAASAPASESAATH